MHIMLSEIQQLYALSSLLLDCKVSTVTVGLINNRRQQTLGFERKRLFTQGGYVYVTRFIDRHGTAEC